MPKRKVTVVYPRRSPRLLLLLLHENNNPAISKPKSTVKVLSLRRSPRFSNHQKAKKIDVKLREFPFRDSAKAKRRKMKENSGHKGIAVEEVGVIVEEWKKEQVECGVEGKRKHGYSEIVEGWTKEQELALQTACFTAKASPHFWKNVSKLVPGKSKQDCFDRFNHDIRTPPRCEPRSRAKTINPSPLHQYSISPSKLLKPTEEKVGRSNILKPKSFLIQKSIENQLQRRLKVDQDRKGDIFSVLEPNIDFSTNAFQPSQALCTPKQQKENKGLLRSCTERSSSSSSSHEKPLSRFSGSSGVQDHSSPLVLKQVKNKVQHEKYVNQLRFRDLRRRAASTQTKLSVIGEGKGIQKTDVVKAAKVALVAEARDAINKFQQSQVNFVDNTGSSDEDNDDDVEFECETEI